MMLPEEVISNIRLVGGLGGAVGKEGGREGREERVRMELKEGREKEDGRNEERKASRGREKGKEGMSSRSHLDPPTTSIPAAGPVSTHKVQSPQLSIRPSSFMALQTRTSYIVFGSKPPSKENISSVMATC